MDQYKSLTFIALQAAIAAGKAILAVYNSNSFEIETKEDQSPLTLADREAHRIISAALQQTNIPVLSEEGANHDYSLRQAWQKLWIVDPLDGTKEFINRNGEFTVNIALVENNRPVLGVLLAPVTGACYFGIVGFGSFLLRNVMTASLHSFDACLLVAQKLPLPENNNSKETVIVASRSHRSAETEAFIANVAQTQHIRTVAIGSALKMGLIADGSAQLYPRFAPTMEWDVAAGHAIISAAGGLVYQVETMQELTYNKPDLRNGWFVAKS